MLVSRFPFDIRIVSSVLNFKSSTYYHWIRDILCRVGEPDVQAELHGHDLHYYNGHWRQDLTVPIFKPENIGEKMAIDEKSIGDDCYTIFTNSETGKIAGICKCHDAGTLIIMMSRLGGEYLDRVKEVTRDMSNTYAEVLDVLFPNAKQVIDKFHETKDGMDYMQAFRVRLKNTQVNIERQEKAAHDKAFKENLKKPPRERVKMSKVYHPEKLENGQTKVELLARSKYLLYKMPNQWTTSQRYRAKLLFKHFPQLEEVYDKICQFRIWYAPSVVEDREQKYNEIMDWINSIDKKSPLRTFADTLLTNLPEVLNYFIDHATNAIAESTNSKIQSAIIKNRGARDLDFFFYRISHFL